MPVLPRTPWLDETDANPATFDPLLDLLRDELRTVIALHRRWSAVNFNELIKHADHIDGGEMSGALDPHSTTTKLIDDGQESKCFPVRRLVRDEVVDPDVVRILGVLRIDRARTWAASFNSLLWHSEPLEEGQCLAHVWKTTTTRSFL